MSAQRSERVTVYVDGFNLYFGLRDAKLRSCYWLNIHELSRNLLKPGQSLTVAKYFTSRISGAPVGAANWMVQKANQKRKRQSDFLDALGTVAGIEIQYGKYLAKPASCNSCHANWTVHEEKMTDVNIATSLLTDAFQDQFDTAILISADSDLVPPVRSVRNLFPHKRALVAFPPQRVSQDLKKVASGYFSIYPATLKKSLLPDPIVLPNGHTLHRPASWT